VFLLTSNDITVYAFLHITKVDKPLPVYLLTISQRYPWSWPHHHYSTPHKQRGNTRDTLNDPSIALLSTFKNTWLNQLLSSAMIYLFSSERSELAGK
jgi:hypothetical protein